MPTDPRDLRILPLEKAETLPSAWYTDPGFHELDRRVIFERTWQIVGHVAQVRNIGDRMVSEVAGNPIVVVRGKDGGLRAFYNVCRHRGGPLATEDGCESMLQCRYHGWTYTLDGELRGVPRWDRVDLFDRKDFGLVPVHVDTWEGFVFVNLDPASPAVPLSDVVAGITERIAPETLPSKRFHSRSVYDVACNWKVYVDNYLEGYHVPLVHPGLFGMLDYREYATETFVWYSLQQSPLRPEASIFGTGHAYYYFIYPNLTLNILPGRLQTNRVIPVSRDRCRVLFEYYYDDIESDEGRRRIEEDKRSAHETQLEDIMICEHVQRGLASNAYDRGRFSVELEGGVWHFQNLIRGAIADNAQSPHE